MVRRERRDKTRARKRKSGTSVNFQLQLTHPSLCSSHSLGQRDLYVYALPWQLSIFSESQLPSFYSIHPHTTASVRARLPRSGDRSPFSAWFARGAREVLRLADGQRRSKLFSTEPPKRYFPVSNVTIPRVIVPPHVLVFECVSPFQYFFLLFLSSLLIARSRNFQSSSRLLKYGRISSSSESSSRILQRQCKSYIE